MTESVQTEEKRSFQAEVSRLLDIVTHSLYSERRVFLRELISNASDACDRLRYEAITRPELTADAPDFRITLEIDKAARTLTVSDNGIGMNEGKLIKLRSFAHQEVEMGDRIGVQNVIYRLRLYYGDAFTFTVSSEPMKGTSVLLKVPISSEVIPQ